MKEYQIAAIIEDILLGGDGYRGHYDLLLKYFARNVPKTGVDRACDIAARQMGKELLDLFKLASRKVHDERFLNRQ